MQKNVQERNVQGKKKVEFDPKDERIPQKLRNRIVKWKTKVPRLQYSQYGPIDKYLNLKFPNSMVKPQGLIRPVVQPLVEVDEAPETSGDGGEVGNISLDSMGQVMSPDMQKMYPDFVVVDYDDSGYDKIRLVVEIGSVYSDQTPSDSAKKKVQEQLRSYMGWLGGEGDRWSDFALGMAMLGTEVSFSRLVRSIEKDPEDPNKTITKPKFLKPGKWVSLYGPEFLTEINALAKKCA